MGFHRTWIFVLNCSINGSISNNSIIYCLLLIITLHALCLVSDSALCFRLVKLLLRHRLKTGRKTWDLLWGTQAARCARTAKATDGTFTDHSQHWRAYITTSDQQVVLFPQVVSGEAVRPGGPRGWCERIPDQGLRDSRDRLKHSRERMKMCVHLKKYRATPRMCALIIG